MRTTDNQLLADPRLQAVNQGKSFRQTLLDIGDGVLVVAGVVSILAWYVREKVGRTFHQGMETLRRHFHTKNEF